MIKSIILDVDGVLIGKKPDYNWPMPNTAVIDALKLLHSRGINISLCTGKGTFSIKKLVTQAGLDDIHIGDGGAVAVNFIRNRIIRLRQVPAELVLEILAQLENRIYTELYTPEKYFVAGKSICEITDKHTEILGRKPVIVPGLSDVVGKESVIKVMPIARDRSEKAEIIRLFKPYINQLSLQWGVHPLASPYFFGIITAAGVSKGEATEFISETTGIALADTLGVGDGLTDWGFIKLCGYKGAMGNADPELKEKVAAAADSGFTGGSVDQNGILDIFTHFGLKIY